MGILQGGDWKESNVVVGLKWNNPESGECGLLCCLRCPPTPASFDTWANPKYQGNAEDVATVLREWTTQREQSFHEFMDVLPQKTCCFGACDDGVDRKQAVEALTAEWVPQQQLQNGVRLDVFWYRYTSSGAEAHRVVDIIVRFFQD